MTMATAQMSLMTPAVDRKDVLLMALTDARLLVEEQPLAEELQGLWNRWADARVHFVIERCLDQKEDQSLPIAKAALEFLQEARLEREFLSSYSANGESFRGFFEQQGH